LRFHIQLFQQISDHLRDSAFTNNLEMVVAIDDFHTHATFNLLDVVIKRAA
jgi:hypothetical protein